MTTRPLALITGASGGIGAEFARQLADDHDLLLASRSREKLEAARAALPVDASRVELLPADLSTAAGVGTVTDHLRTHDRTVELLVNNAGSGIHGHFLDSAEADVSIQVGLDVSAVVALTRALVPPMVAAGHGGMINVASTAGFQPTPGLTVYAAAKAFVLSFSEALAVELRGTGVTVTVVAPGTVDTGFFAAAGARFEAGGMLTAEAVVTAALRGHRDGTTLVVPGLRNKLGTLGPRVLPRALMARMAGWTARAR